MTRILVILLLAAFAASLALAEAHDPPASDAEILALLIAHDENQVHAAATVEEKKVDGVVLALAQTIHQDHRKDIDDTKKLTAKIGVTPKDTPAVLKLRATGKANLAKLLPLTGQELKTAFVNEMLEGHREALLMLDELLKAAQNEELKQHLSTARQNVAKHLQAAENIKN